MATVLKKKPSGVKPGAADAAAQRVLYLYGVSKETESLSPVSMMEGIDGEASVEAVACEGYVCWVSRVSREEFADKLSDNMQNLDWLANAGLRHQRAVAAIAEKGTMLPARFGTVFLSEVSMAQHVRDRKRAFANAFDLVADADEWGIKVFAVPKAKAKESRGTPASGVEYLKQKAQSRQPKADAGLDADMHAFAQRLTSLAVAASPGGKASAGQPGLLWHGSFLVRRKDRKKLEAVLHKSAERWRGIRRIDWSGPWPPYSFVGAHAE